ncbi:ABC transporter ATP-binding protein [Natranaeroarchaeum aerophilus]|uniref:Molybdate/tungstate import ATP-binding protein WtpC n=1 Tax=Natranaeroarchaeum aerophilus TaxID=2917711 RepID=A0AAE3FTK6_9EURY|nr:ABC transporter ATP-binding protein [Natranaeroarchaeum aerophilus]MCL9815078.1 ABC transporter ATP-binding protein [Natranaeroarchaeum aerophilus]
MTLAIDGLSKRYGDEHALEDVSLSVESGELVALLGPSGCGKTTLVQAVAGHLSPTTGTVTLRDTDVTDRPPERRRVGVVFQQSTLFPHMTVAENVAYGLKGHGIASDRRDERVREYLDLVGLDGRDGAYPSELSGGQQRRVELARALAPQPDVLLLDEPLSALDRSLRTRLRDEIGRIQRETGVTTLFVTHDQEEAMALADRLVVMNDGQVAGVGQPRELYESPSTEFVAEFLGRTNILEGAICGADPATLSVAGRPGRVRQPVPSDADRAVTIHARPRHLALSGRDDARRTDASSMEQNSVLSFPVTVSRVIDRGTRYDLVCRTDEDVEFVVERRSDPPSVGEPRWLSISVDDLLLFDAETGKRIPTGAVESIRGFATQSEGAGGDAEEDALSSDVR